MVATYIIDSMTGWFSSWFDFWPFNRPPEPAVDPEKQGWFNWGPDEKADPAPAQSGPKWSCKWNPVC